jgi:ribosomal protein S18 acetylase RimI-like enzyme
MHIRPYRPSDRAALYRICLRTGDNGDDATGRYTDPRLLGHVYVGPYLALAPRLAFVLDPGDGEPVGYALGARDTVEFAARCEASWWPPLRRRYPDPAGVPAAERTPDQRLAALIHHPPRAPAALTDRYPSHLHVDLLPVAQGRGHGRALLERLLAALAEAGSTGVHLGVAAANRRAIGFYRRLGFAEVERSPGGLTMAMPLSPGR